MGMHSTYTATHYKDLNIDWQARAVTRHGEDISLTPQEFALLQVLFDHRGQAVSRGDLLHTAWGYPSIGITRTVDVHIQHLRRKLGLKQEIQTIYRKIHLYAPYGSNHALTVRFHKPYTKEYLSPHPVFPN